MDILKQTKIFRYQLLSRLILDCEYYLGHGQRSNNHLWGGNVPDQIKNMKDLYNSFDKDNKPIWSSMEQIEEFETKMLDTDKKPVESWEQEDTDKFVGNNVFRAQNPDLYPNG